MRKDKEMKKNFETKLGGLQKAYSYYFRTIGSIMYARCMFLREYKQYGCR